MLVGMKLTFLYCTVSAYSNQISGSLPSEIALLTNFNALLLVRAPNHMTLVCIWVKNLYITLISYLALLWKMELRQFI
jgi:hypothetical protein